MTASLGVAKIILDANAEPLIAAQAIAYKDAIDQAKVVTKQLAQQNQVRVNDVRQSARIVIDENKKAAQEAAKAAQQLEKDREKSLQSSLSAVKTILKNEQAAYEASEKAKAKAESDLANQRKAYTQEVLKFNQKAYNDEVAAAKKAAQEKIAADKATQSAGVLGTGVSAARVGGTIATLAGFGAIASGALVVREALLSINEAAVQTEQSEKSLDAAFGASAAVFKKSADDIADANGRSNNEVEKGTAFLGILQKQYGLTGKDIQDLIGISIQFNKQFGGDQIETFKDVSNAIQGETAALEKYGITLQANAVKNSPLLTEAERKNYEALSLTEQALIRLRILRDEAAKRSSDELSAQAQLIDSQNKYNAELEKTLKLLGEGVKGPESSFLNKLTGFLAELNKTAKVTNEINTAIAQLNTEEQSAGRESRFHDTAGFFEDPQKFAQDAAVIQARVAENRRDEEERVSKAAAQSAIDDINAKNKAIADAETTASKRRITILETEVERAAKIRLDDIAEQKHLAEAQQTEELRNLKEQHDAEIASINEVEYERKNISEHELARINQQKDIAIKAADDERDDALAGIEAAKQATHDAADAAIRDLEIQRDEKLRLQEVTHDLLQKELEEQKRVRDAARKDEDRAVADDIEKQQRRLEDAHKSNLRRLDQEADKQHDKSTGILRDIDKQISKEDERHRKADQHIDDEAQKQKDAIDAQIRALDDAQTAEDNARRKSDLQDKVSQAQQNLTQAQGTGSPQDIIDARGKLTSAIKIGDPQAVKKAQDELIAISGQGQEAIAKAQKELADAQKDLLAEGNKEERDAQKEKLQLAKDEIDKQATAEKRAEDDRDRRRKSALDKDKDSEADRLKDALRKIDQRKDKENDAYEADKRGASDTAEHAKRVLEDRRRDEDNAYEDAKKAEDDRYKHEKENIDDTYNNEDHGLIPTIRRSVKDQDEQYATATSIVQSRYKAERQEIYDTYDDPVNGLIQKHKDEEEAAQHAHSLALAVAVRHYEEEQRVIQETYRNPDGKSGILDHLDALAEDTRKALDDTKQKFEDYKNNLVGDDGVITQTWDDAIKAAKKYFDYLANNRGITVKPIVYPPGFIGPIPPSDGGSGGGAGVTVPPPSDTQPSGPPPPPTSETVDDVDVSGGNWPTRFGWNLKYNGGQRAGAGWEEDGNIAAWDRGPTRHKGIDLQAGIGKAVGSFTDGTVVTTIPYHNGEAGGNMLVVAKGDKAFWYMHLNDFVAHSGDHVKRGQLIAHSGNTGTEAEGAHLHFEVRTGYPPLNNGALSIDDLESGRNSIDPRPYVYGQDTGGLFTDPTLTYNMRTGARSVLAENGPEKLLGRRDTQMFASMGLNRLLDRSPVSTAYNGGLDYAAVGASLSGAPTINNNTVQNAGDTLNYHGVAPESMIQKFRADQRRQRVLRGRRP